MPTALITGVTGQDGWYLTEYLHLKGYEVHGLIRPTSSRAAHTAVDVTHSGSVENYASILSVFAHNKFDEVYHLAAQSFVAESFVNPFTTLDININGTLHVLEAIRHLQPECKFYFAATSEMFGNSPPPQSEKTPFAPRSPYGVSKLAGYNLTKNYREAYNLFACSGILFNHESPRRGPQFVTQYIVQTICDRVRRRSTQPIKLGNVAAYRDWGHAQDYVQAMHTMLQQPEPDDYVISTGVSHSVYDFYNTACRHAGWSVEIETDKSRLRPTEVHTLRGDYNKAYIKLGWKPSTSFEDLVADMVFAELKR